MRMGWNGRSYHLLAALLLVGGVACGSESDPSRSGSPLGDEVDGPGGSDNGKGGAGGYEPPGKGGSGGTKIDGKGGFGGIDGLGGTLGNVAGSGGVGGVGGSGGNGGEVNKGDACGEGEGLLVLRKDYCAPAMNNVPSLSSGHGYENCKHVKSDDPVYVSVNKVAPKEKLIWEGTISEANEFWECVPVGDYVVAEDCSKLPQGVSCYDEYPVELKVKERKATKHTFINLLENEVPIEMGSITLSKEYCLPVAPVPVLTGGTNGTLPYDCEAAKSYHEAYVEILDATTYGVVWSGNVSEGYPVKVDLPVGAYQVKEKCDALPPAFGCAYDAPVDALVEAWMDTPVDLINLVYLETVALYKEVEGCIYGACDAVAFEVEVKKDGYTPKVEYRNDGIWFSNDELEAWVSVSSPGELLLPRGSYVAKEKPAEAFKPKHAGGDMVPFVVPNGAVTFYNVFDKGQCHDGLDNEGNYMSDCAEYACLENDYLGCSRDSCYWGAFMEFKRVCNIGDTACMAADFYVEVESKNTIYGDTPSFGASYLFEGGQGMLHIPAPCGTYAVRVMAPTGYVAHDEIFDIDVPSYYFPLMLYPPGGNVPEDPEEL